MMCEPLRAAIAGVFLSAAASALPAYLFLHEPPRQVPLPERIAMARADLQARPCRGDDDCQLRVALFGIDPGYFERPDDWLESGCLARGDDTACRYLAAWRAIEPED